MPMRPVLCCLLSLCLLFSLIFAGSIPRQPALPAGRAAAWWGLLFPGLFGLDGDENVIFSWPLLERVGRILGFA